MQTGFTARKSSTSPTGKSSASTCMMRKVGVTGPRSRPSVTSKYSATASRPLSASRLRRATSTLKPAWNGFGRLRVWIQSTNGCEMIVMVSSRWFALAVGSMALLISPQLNRESLLVRCEMEEGDWPSCFPEIRWPSILNHATPAGMHNPMHPSWKDDSCCFPVSLVSLDHRHHHTLTSRNFCQGKEKKSLPHALATNTIRRYPPAPPIQNAIPVEAVPVRFGCPPHGR